MQTDSHLLDHLNPKQREAVEYVDGPLLILAGAGSGKTRVLTHKIAWLVSQYQVPLYKILAVTFTNKAAKEMVERVEKLVGVSVPPRDQWVLTFHSFCNKILQRHAELLGYQKAFVIYDSGDQLSVVKRILNDMDIDPKVAKPSSVQYAISDAKNKLLTPHKMSVDSTFQEIVRNVYAEYQDQLRRNNAMDFDDLMINALALLSYHPDILEKYQNQFDYVLIDEYQDINLPQYMIAEKLSEKHKRLFVVGDGDQNIYSWRGANMQNILNFEKDFPRAKVILLEQNYRSTTTILEIANAVIRHNKMRTDKNLWTANGEGEKVTMFVASNEYNEAEYIGKSILAKIESGTDANEIAVLYRTNAMSRVLEEMMLQYNIPYRVYGGFRFYERKEIKDILAYLRLVFSDQDDVALQRVINVPTRKIGKLTVERIILTSQQTKDPLMIIARGEAPKNPSIQGFIQLIDGLRADYVTNNWSLGELIDQIVSRSGYKKWLKQEDSQEAITRLENIQELITSTQDGDYNLEEFLSMTALMTQQDEPSALEHTVTLMTLHSAKGLEYDVVFLAGMEENMLPHQQSVDSPEQIEEERRLCYVGITRARHELTISAASHRNTYYEGSRAQDMSRFFFEMPAERIKVEVSHKAGGFNHMVTVLRDEGVYGIGQATAPAVTGWRAQSSPRTIMTEASNVFDSDFSVGDLVRSPVFGDGVVVQTIGHGVGISLQIKFGSTTKLILPKYGKLEKVKAS